MSPLSMFKRLPKDAFERLECVVQFTQNIFDTSRTPAALLLFSLERVPDRPDVYRDTTYLGKYDVGAEEKAQNSGSVKFTAHVPDGQIYFRANDSVSERIGFERCVALPDENVKSSSRHNIKLKVTGIQDHQIDILLKTANELVDQHRRKTNDISPYLTPMYLSGNSYRWRMHLGFARTLLSQAAKLISHNSTT